MKKVFNKISLVFISLGLALLYAVSRIEVTQRGYEVSRLRSKVAEMERANALLRSKVVENRSTKKLAAWTKRLGLVPPKPGEVLFLEEKE